MVTITNSCNGHKIEGSKTVEPQMVTNNHKQLQMDIKLSDQTQPATSSGKQSKAVASGHSQTQSQTVTNCHGHTQSQTATNGHGHTVTNSHKWSWSHTVTNSHK